MYFFQKEEVVSIAEKNWLPGITPIVNMVNAAVLKLHVFKRLVNAKGKSGVRHFGQALC